MTSSGGGNEEPDAGESEELVEPDLPGSELHDLSDQTSRPPAETPTALPDGERIDRAVDRWKSELDAYRTGERWTDAELDAWFENDFGGPGAFDFFFSSKLLSAGKLASLTNPDLAFGFNAYRRLRDAGFAIDREERPWPLLSHEAKERFRHGWHLAYGSMPPDELLSETDVGQELIPILPNEDLPARKFDIERLVVPGDHLNGSETARPKVPRWILVGGGLGIIGLVLVVVFVLGGSDDPDPVTVEDEPAVAVEETLGTIDEPPTSIVEEEPATTFVDEAAETLVADVAASAFPVGWNFTATKTAAIVPAPDFISATPIGAVLPWSVAVTESCTSDDCTYTSVIRPLIPEVVSGEVPEATWVVGGAEWSLDAIWLSGQSSFGDGTVCLIEKHWTYQFTVTEAEVIEGRSVATAIEGTWIQRDKLDLAASTGDLSLCGDPWELADEWSVVGVAAG